MVQACSPSYMFSPHSLAQGLISYRKSSGARKGLASPFNFAPFYLEESCVRGRGVRHVQMPTDKEFLASWAGTAVPNRHVARKPLDSFPTTWDHEAQHCMILDMG